jgi:hypothetical protein
MRIKTGIGVGGAQIFDTSGIQDAYYKQYLQKQKQDQAYAEDLANNLAKYDTTGLIPDDAKYADKLYSDLKNKYLQVNIKDPKQRALANAELKSGMQKIKDFTYNAKKFVGDNQKVGIELAKNRFMYPDEVIQTYDKNIKGQPYYQVMQSGIGDVNQILTQRNPDNSLIDKSLKTLDAQLKGAAEKNVGGIKTELTPDKKQQVYQYTTDQKTAKVIAKSLLTDDATKANWYYNFKQANPNIEANDDIVSDYIVKQREAMYQGNPYAFKGGVKAVAKEKTGVAGGGKPKDEDVWESYIAGAFGKNKDINLRNIKSIAGDKAEITPKGSGYNVKIKPTVDVLGGNQQMFMGNIGAVTKYASNPAELRNILASAGITGKGALSNQRLGGVSKPTTQSQPKPSTGQGKKVIKGF